MTGPFRIVLKVAWDSLCHTKSIQSLTSIFRCPTTIFRFIFIFRFEQSNFTLLCICRFGRFYWNKNSTVKLLISNQSFNQWTYQHIQVYVGDRLDQSFPSRQGFQRSPTQRVFEHLSLTLLLYKMMDIQEHLLCICKLLWKGYKYTIWVV